MKVFLRPIGLHSPAMVRIANALVRYKPDSVYIIDSQQEADLVVFYPIGIDWTEHFQRCLDRGQKYAMVQCCYKTSAGNFDQWWPWWEKSECVWTYLNLNEGSTHDPYYLPSIKWYCAPLGIDPMFADSRSNGIQRRAIVTTGTVSHPCAEAIEEVWIAAKLLHLNVYHIGPFPQGIEPHNEKWKHVKIVGSCSDDALMWHYSIARWVCSLRHTEGFELPAAEGLACGARPVLFDQPDLRHWYGDHAEYVDDCSGRELVNQLVKVFSGPDRYVENFERSQVRQRFNWEKICKGFWERIVPIARRSGQEICLAHMEPEPCQICAAYIAAGL